WRGRLDESARWLERAEHALGHYTEPNAALMLCAARARLEFARGRHAQAAAACREAERMEGLLAMPHVLATRMHAINLEMLVRVGETERVERTLAEPDQEVRETCEMRVVLATLSLAHGDPEAAVAGLTPLPDHSSTGVEASVWVIEALLLEAIARDALRDPAAPPP